MTPTRRSVRSGYQPPTVDSRVAHGERLRDDARAVQLLFERSRTRTGSPDVDPRLVLVLEGVSGQAGSLAPYGLQFLDDRNGAATVAFATDSAMTEFFQRLDEYSVDEPQEDADPSAAQPARVDASVRSTEGELQQSSPSDQEMESARFKGFYDAIESVRAYGPQDRLTSQVEAALAGLHEGDTTAVDVECWWTSDQDAAETLQGAVVDSAEAAGGETLDTYLNHRAGVSLVRVVGERAAISALAEVSAVRRIVPLPILQESVDAAAITIDDLPTLRHTANDAPLVAVLDSGVQGDHPLLAGAVAGVLDVVGSDGVDRFGHGTAVASRVLYGTSLDTLGSASPDLEEPPCRILSIKVLDDNGEAPDSRLFPKVVDQAVRLATEQGARIMCLAVADEASPDSGDLPGPIAAVIDQLSAELDVVVIVPMGNVDRYALHNRIADAPAVPELLDGAWTHHVLDPAAAAFALTVTATGRDAPPPRLPLRRLSGTIDPAAYARVGAEDSPLQLPDLSDSGGSLTLDPNTGQVLALDDGRCVVASVRDGRVAESTHGTSLSTASVARVAAAVLGADPEAPAVRVRALVMQSCDPPQLVNIVGTDTTVAAATRRLLGHGRPSLTRAARSDVDDVVLTAEGTLGLDRVHFYTLATPPTFRERGGERGVEVSLSFVCPARAHRREYLRAVLKFWIVRGMSADELYDTFAKVADRPEEDPTLSQLARGRQVIQTPSVTDRSRGANLRARRVLRQRFRDEDDTMTVVISAHDRWADTARADHAVKYGLAVRLWRKGVVNDLYEEVAADLRARARAETEAQAEAEATG